MSLRKKLIVGAAFAPLFTGISHGAYDHLNGEFNNASSVMREYGDRVGTHYKAVVNNGITITAQTASHFKNFANGLIGAVVEP